MGNLVACIHISLVYLVCVSFGLKRMERKMTLAGTKDCLYLFNISVTLNPWVKLEGLESVKKSN